VAGVHGFTVLLNVTFILRVYDMQVKKTEMGKACSMYGEER
jgi:hypothetical protein